MSVAIGLVGRGWPLGTRLFSFLGRLDGRLGQWRRFGPLGREDVASLAGSQVLRRQGQRLVQLLHGVFRISKIAEMKAEQKVQGRRIRFRVAGFFQGLELIGVLLDVAVQLRM